MMPRRHGDVWFPIALSAFGAGPVGLAIMLVGSAIQTPPQPGLFANVAGVVLGFLVLLAFATVLGTIVGAIPSIVGVVLLAHAGDHYRLARHPFVWAATGALLGLAVVSLFRLYPHPDEHPRLWAMAVGTICLSLARRRLRWSD